MGTNGVPRSGANLDKNNFAPRIGMAYRPSNKNVIRASFGIYYAAPQFEINRNLAINPPYAGSYTFNNNLLDFRRPESGPGLRENLHPAGATIRGLELNLATPYVEQWNINWQRQLPVRYPGDAGVCRHQGRQAPRRIDINQPPPGPGAVAARRPYPVLSSIIMTDFLANSIYHGLQATFEKRYAKGLSFLASYTFGHAIDNADLFGGGHQDMLNLQADRSNSPYDIRHTFVYSFNYELPFGRNGEARSCPAGPGLAGERNSPAQHRLLPDPHGGSQQLERQRNPASRCGGWL